MASSLLCAQAPKKVAVYPFDDRTNSDKSINLGAKVADALIAKLSDNGAVMIVDRQYLEKIAAEKNLKFDANFDPTSAPKSGLLGVVDVLIVGQIDSFHKEVKASQTGFGSFKITTQTGVTSLKATARLISIERGVILSAPMVHSDLKQQLSSSSAIKGFSAGNGNDAGKNDEALLKLVDQNVEDVAGQLAKSITGGALTPPPASMIAGPAVAPQPPVVAAPRTIKAKFAGIDDGAVIINKGKSDGVQKGDKFDLTRLNTDMKDPDTGKPILRHKPVCQLVIESVDESSSTGKCTGAVPRVGDEASLAP